MVYIVHIAWKTIYIYANVATIRADCQPAAEFSAQQTRYAIGVCVIKIRTRAAHHQKHETEKIIAAEKDTRGMRMRRWRRSNRELFGKSVFAYDKTIEDTGWKYLVHKIGTPVMMIIFFLFYELIEVTTNLLFLKFIVCQFQFCKPNKDLNFLGLSNY